MSRAYRRTLPKARRRFSLAVTDSPAALRQSPSTPEPSISGLDDLDWPVAFFVIVQAATGCASSYRPMVTPRVQIVQTSSGLAFVRAGKQYERCGGAAP